MSRSRKRRNGNKDTSQPSNKISKIDYDYPYGDTQENIDYGEDASTDVDLVIVPLLLKGVRANRGCLKKYKMPWQEAAAQELKDRAELGKSEGDEVDVSVCFTSSCHECFVDLSSGSSSAVTLLL